jgi:hypothetical protein
MLVFGQCAFAQNQEVFKKNVLSQYGSYFEKVEFSKEGLLYLDAKESYFSMSTEMKISTMEAILSKWNENPIIVRYQYKREVWKKDNSGDVNLLDLWDLNTPYLQQPAGQRTLQTTNVHPWFTYFGGSSSFNSDYSSLYLNGRIGCYLWKNIWDIAISGSIGNISKDYISSIGLMSKVYYPMTMKEKYRISPYVGLGIMYNYQETNNQGTSSSSYPFYTGISWFVGPGSFDVGFQFGQNFTTTIGYTFSPSKSKKSK